MITDPPRLHQCPHPRPVQRFAHIDALRGVAAAMVVLQHAFEAAHSGGAAIYDPLLASINLGRFGVILFFLISGFVVPFSFSGERPLRKFAISRLFRLYPAYWVSLAAFAVLAAVQGRPLAGEVLWANMTMLQGLLGVRNVGDVYWTLLYEMIFYALCAALWAMRLMRSVALVGTMAALLLGCAALQGITGADSEVVIVPFYFGQFMLGMMFRMAYVDRDPAAVRWLACLAVLAVLAGAVMGGGFFPVFENRIPFLRAPALVAAMCLPMAVFAAVLWWRPAPGRAAVHLGAISYSVYLFQQIVLERVAAVIAPGEWPVCYVLAVAAATVAVAAAVYRWVEKPMVGLGRSVAGHRGAWLGGRLRA